MSEDQLESHGTEYDQEVKPSGACGAFGGMHEHFVAKRLFVETRTTGTACGGNLQTSASEASIDVSPSLCIILSSNERMGGIPAES
jgi:hypothetical protein